MIKMWKDYYEMVLKPEQKWLKMYWFKYVFFSLICFGTMYKVISLWFGQYSRKLDIEDLED